MKKYIYLTIALFALSCGQNAHDEKMSAEERLTVIRDLEKKSKESVGEFDTAMALALVNNYGRYAKENADDEQSALFLSRAGEMSMALRKGELAIGFFDQVIADYPDFERLPYCMYLKAFVYEDILKDLENAEKAYRGFLAAYPDHEMADAAKFSIRNLGKSPAEIIRDLKEKGDTTAGS